jgi:hypothetical protein
MLVFSAVIAYGTIFVGRLASIEFSKLVPGEAVQAFSAAAKFISFVVMI